ncbi:MAG: sulfite exporter TauE/SafE family protein [Flavobacteriales bacterium]
MELQDTIIVLAALGASLLTLLSGFGLGTLLLPVFALFFPLPLAVLLTAVVHLLNNLFKLGLLWKHIDRRVVLLFGLPGVAGALLGAWLLEQLGGMPALYTGVRVEVDVLHLALAALMVLFAITELVPSVASFAFAPKYLLPGGFASGLLGGFSGHQGALRTMFLLRSGLSKEALLATGVAIACLVDFTRIPVYLSSPLKDEVIAHWPLLCAATAAAFIGAYWGKILIPKVTLRGVQLIVAGFMIVVAVGLVCGLV